MSSNEELLFDKNEIDKKIENKNYRHNEAIIFDFIDKKMKTRENQKYFVKIKQGNELYMGVLTEDFKKELFGYSLFKGGDEYLGEILEEKKHGFGIYNFKKENDIQDLYIGHFEDNIINGEGIYINILNEEKPKNKRSKYKLYKYNCYIGEFEKGKFKKGKIYIFNQDFEKLTFQNEEGQEQDSNEEFSIEKHKNFILVSKYIKKNGIISDGFIINIKDKDEIETQFSFKIKEDSNYIYDYLNDEIEKELLEKFNKYKNFKIYNEKIPELFNEMIKNIDFFQSNLMFAKSRAIKKDYELYFYDKYGKF